MATVSAAAAAAVPTPSVTVAAVPAPPPRTVSPTDSGEEQVISSTSSPAAVRETATACGSTTELIGENERLRKENTQLNKELNHMKNMCNNIYVMMSNYSNNNYNATGDNNNTTNNQSAEGSSSQAVRALDLLPFKRIPDESAATAAECGGDDQMEVDEAGAGARLFGVSIGGKRVRDNGGAVAAEHDQELQLQQPGAANVKSEPLDNENG